VVFFFIFFLHSKVIISYYKPIGNKSPQTASK